MAETFGAYGKIPSMGDFLRIGLSASFVKVWDEWLQRSLIVGQERMGEAWKDSYFSAPIWRFTLPPQHTGAAAISGILMASVDRVGRQYPLTLICAHPPDRFALRHFANRRVFEHLEALALTVLDRDLSRDDLAAALEEIHLQPVSDQGVVPPRYAGAVPPEAVLAAQGIAPQIGNSGLWTTTMDGDNRMMLCSALPNPQEFLALFDLRAAYWQNMSMA